MNSLYEHFFLFVLNYYLKGSICVLRSGRMNGSFWFFMNLYYLLEFILTYLYIYLFKSMTHYFPRLQTLIYRIYERVWLLLKIHVSSFSIQLVFNHSIVRTYFNDEMLLGITRLFPMPACTDIVNNKWSL